MKKHASMAFLLIIVLALTSCVQVPSSEDASAQSSATSEDTDGNFKEDSQPPMPFQDVPENGFTIFDFTELLAVNDYPYGIWTVNQLIGKYGVPEDIYAWYDDVLHDAGIKVCFVNTTINLLPQSVQELSFYKEGLEGGEYCVNENDKDIELFVYSVHVVGNDNKLPRGITIGESKKEQIIAAYGERPYYEVYDQSCSSYSIRYRYDFLEEERREEVKELAYGSIIYVFNNKGALIQAMIIWSLPYY